MADLTRLRARIGGWTAIGLPPEHQDRAPEHPPLPPNFAAVKGRIQALKRELLNLP